jgi:hypothetical protein
MRGREKTKERKKENKRKKDKKLFTCQDCF